MRDRILLQTSPNLLVEKKTRKCLVARRRRLTEFCADRERGRQHGLLCDLYTVTRVYTLCSHCSHLHDKVPTSHQDLFKPDSFNFHIVRNVQHLFSLYLQDTSY